MSRADVYRWVDELGVTHYTTDRDTVPRRFRGEAHAIEASPAPASAPRATRAPEATVPPTALATPTSPETTTPTPEPAEPAPTASAPSAPPEPEISQPAPSAAPVFPGPPTTTTLAPNDPRAQEVAELEAQIATDRETLRQMISTKRWDSAELASDPAILEIAERLPRLQAQLEALRAEPIP